MKSIRGFVAVSLTLAVVAQSLAAQSVSLGLRGSGSFPTGAFAQPQSSSSSTLIEGAKNGFGYGLDVGLGLGPIGVYAGFDQIKFDCQTTTCRSDGKYTLSGVTVGAKLSPPMMEMLRPFIKAGVTFNELRGGYGGQSSNRLTTDRTPGYEIGAGLDVGVLGLLSFTPQVRYIGQNFKAQIPGVTTPTTATGTGITYFTFDLGLSVHTPFGM